MQVCHLSVGDLFQFRRQRLPEIYEVVHIGTRPALGYRLAGQFYLGKSKLLPEDQRGSVQTWSPNPDLHTSTRQRDVRKLWVDLVGA